MRKVKDLFVKEKWMELSLVEFGMGLFVVFVTIFLFTAVFSLMKLSFT